MEYMALVSMIPLLVVTIMLGYLARNSIRRYGVQFVVILVTTVAIAIVFALIAMTPTVHNLEGIAAIALAIVIIGLLIDILAAQIRDHVGRGMNSDEKISER